MLANDFLYPVEIMYDKPKVVWKLKMMLDRQSSANFGRLSGIVVLSSCFGYDSCHQGCYYGDDFSSSAINVNLDNVGSMDSRFTLEIHSVTNCFQYFNNHLRIEESVEPGALSSLRQQTFPPSIDTLKHS